MSFPENGSRRARRPAKEYPIGTQVIDAKTVQISAECIDTEAGRTFLRGLGFSDQRIEAVLAVYTPVIGPVPAMGDATSYLWLEMIAKVENTPYWRRLEYCPVIDGISRWRRHELEAGQLAFAIRPERVVSVNSGLKHEMLLTAPPEFDVKTLGQAARAGDTVVISFQDYVPLGGTEIACCPVMVKETHIAATELMRAGEEKASTYGHYQPTDYVLVQRKDVENTLE